MSDPAIAAPTSELLRAGGHGPAFYQLRRHASRLLREEAAPQGIDQREGRGSYLAGLRTWLWRVPWGARTPLHANYPRLMAVSGSGRLIAVLDQAEVAIFSDENSFIEPCGIYSGLPEIGIHMHAVWIDGIDILAVASTKNAVLLLDSKAKEIQLVFLDRQAAKEYIVGIFSKRIDDSNDHARMVVLTSKCTSYICGASLKGFEKMDQKEKWGHIQSALKKNHPHGISCLCFNAQMLILAVAGPTSEPGRFGVSLWRVSESLTSFQFLHCVNNLNGLLSQTSYLPIGSGRTCLPKLLVSNNLKYVVLLDFEARLHIVYVNRSDDWMLKEAEINTNTSSIPLVNSNIIDTQGEKRKHIVLNSHNRSEYFTVLSIGQVCKEEIKHQSENLVKVKDVSWYSENIVALVKEDGHFNIVLIPELISLLSVSPLFCASNVHVVGGERKHIFLLEDIFRVNLESPEEFSNITAGLSDVSLPERNETKGWRLISLLEHSLAEIYRYLIEHHSYNSALQLAREYNLNPENVYKARWLSSDYGQESLQQNLEKVQDISWVLNECLNKVSPNAEAMNGLLQYGLHITECYRQAITVGSIVDAFQVTSAAELYLRRLYLLQYKDRLETFLGICMSRFIPKDYIVFRSAPLKEAAIRLAEGAKIGALYLMYNRHVYSLAPHILRILECIPETLSPYDYGHLISHIFAPESNVSLRKEDWVEKNEILEIIKSSKANFYDSTEHIVKLRGFEGPSREDIVEWFKMRARTIDKVSGQLENSLTLLDLGVQKGLKELETLLEDTSDLYKIVFGRIDSEDAAPHLFLSDWEQLNDYDKFRVMLDGVTESNVLERLKEQAIPFMNRRCTKGNSIAHVGANEDSQRQSFLVAWLEEVVRENKLEICAVVINEACKTPQVSRWFKDKSEVIDVALSCIYSSTRVDLWDLMASMLSHLSLDTQSADKAGSLENLNLRKEAGGLENTDRSSFNDLERKLQQAKGHVEAGYLLSQYQAEKPMKFFLDAKNDFNGVEQLVHLLLSNCACWQPAKSESEWAIVWNDMQSLQEKAFPFLDRHFLFTEYFCALLAAEKFSLARTQLKSTGNHAFAGEKAKKTVVDMFKKALDKNMKVDDLMDIANILSLGSVVEAEIAREAAASGDLERALDLCVSLMNKDYGLIWDLAAAIARGPSLEGLELNLRKKLLGFALSHSDDDSIGELLNAWKELDLSMQCSKLRELGKHGGIVSEQQTSQTELYEQCVPSDYHADQCELGSELSVESLEAFREVLQKVSRSYNITDTSDWNIFQKERKKLLRFCCAELPFLLKLTRDSQIHLKSGSNSVRKMGFISEAPNIVRECSTISSQAIAVILYGLGINNVLPSDELICYVAREAMGSWDKGEKDLYSCGYLLNLYDPCLGIKVIEEELEKSCKYAEVCQILKVGLTFSSLQDTALVSMEPIVRRDKLCNLLKAPQSCGTAGDSGVPENHQDVNRNRLWTSWNAELIHKLKIVEQAVELGKVVPDIEVQRFIKNDDEYIRRTIRTYLSSTKCKKESRISQGLELAALFGVDKWQDDMFSKEMICALRSTQIISQAWQGIDVTAESLSSLDTMISLFDLLAAKAELPQHMSSLKALLEEWTSMLEPESDTMHIVNEESPYRGMNAHDGWGDGEDWGDEWENFDEARHIENVSSETGDKINAVHSCWKTVLQGLSCSSSFEVLQVLDKYRIKDKPVLLSKDEAVELVNFVSEKEPMLAFQISLLLPYNDAWNIGLHHYERKLRSIKFYSECCTELRSEHGEHETIIRETDSSSASQIVQWVDSSLLILAMAASEFVSYIMADRNFSFTFSTLSAAMMLSMQDLRTPMLGTICQEEQCFMRQIAFPYFIAELVCSRHYFIAGGLLLQYLRVHPALCTVNAAYAALSGFLEAQITSGKDKTFNFSSKHDEGSRGGSCYLRHLPATVEFLQSQLANKLSLALKVISKDSS